MLMRLTTSRETESVAAAVEGTTAIDAATASTAAGRRSVRCVDNTGMPLSFSAYGVSWRARAKEMRSALDGQGPSPLLLGSPAPRFRRGLGDVGRQSTQSLGWRTPASPTSPPHVFDLARQIPARSTDVRDGGTPVSGKTGSSRTP